MDPVDLRSKRRKRQTTKGRFRFNRSKLPLLIFIVLLLYVTVSLGTRFDQLQVMQRDLQAMEQEIQEISAKNAGLHEQLENLQSDKYVEQLAREKLGLVKPGEARIIPVQPETPLDDSIRD